MSFETAREQIAVAAALARPKFRLNCNGCGRFMIEQGRSVGPGGRTRWYYCDHCNRESVIDEPEILESGGSISAAAAAEGPKPRGSEASGRAEPPVLNKSGGSDVEGR